MPTIRGVTNKYLHTLLWLKLLFSLWNVFSHLRCLLTTWWLLASTPNHVFYSLLGSFSETLCYDPLRRVTIAIINSVVLFTWMISCNPKIALLRRHFHPHFAQWKTKAHGAEVTWLGSQSDKQHSQDQNPECQMHALTFYELYKNHTGRKMGELLNSERNPKVKGRETILKCMSSTPPYSSM